MKEHRPQERMCLSPFASKMRREVPRMKDSTPHGLKWLQFGVLIIVFLGTMTALVAQHLSFLPPSLAALLASHETATPFFSLTAFRSLRPGMTEEQVRDAVGYPLECENTAGAEMGTRIVWSFTVPKGEAKGYFRHCLLTFDGKSRRVIKIHDRDAAFTPALVRWWTDAIHAKVGALRLYGPDKRERILSPEDQTPCIVLLVPTGYSLLMTNAPDGLAGNMKDALSSHGVVDVDLATVLIEDTAYDEREWASACPNVFTKSSPPLPVARGVLCLLYARGNLYALPAVDLWGAPNQYIPDIQWLLKRLGAAPS